MSAPSIKATDRNGEKQAIEVRSTDLSPRNRDGRLVIMKARSPLAGIKVLDLGQYITGPFASVILAELGADVLKIESPTGDPFRSWEGGPVKATFVAFNRGKRSAMLDLKTQDGKGIFEKFVGEADILIENFRPGVMNSFGLSATKCLEINPQLVYCGISGFGVDGPYRDKPSFDGVAMALSGVSSLLIDAEDARVRGPAFADTVTGYVAAIAVLAALQSRTETGVGSIVDLSMYGALAHFMTPSLYRFAQEGIEENPYTRPHNSQVFVFYCGDGKPLSIHLSAPNKFWLGLCSAIDRPDLIVNTNYESRESRRRNHELLRAELSSVFMSDTRQAWINRLEQSGVPVAPMNTVSEVLADAGLSHLGHVVSQSESGVMTLAVGFPMRLDGDVLPGLSVAPKLGEHTTSGFATRN